MSTRWDERIPNIENVRFAAVWVHSVEAFDEFETDAASIREQARTDPQRRAALLQAFDFMVAHPPTPDEWFSVTNTSFCTRAQLRAYLRAFYDYVFGDREEPVLPPPNDEPCPHERDDEGRCVVALADRAAATRETADREAEEER